MIFLDNGSTTKVDEKVINAITKTLNVNYGNAGSLHDMGQKSKELIKEARVKIANELNCQPDEIYFTSGGTESNNLAIKGILHNKKGHIITSKIEHPSVLETFKELEKEGFEISYISVNKDGIINLEELKRTIKENTLLISVMHANNEIGTIQPVEEISNIAKEKNIIFHSDCVQSFKKIKVDSKLFDLISLSAHKIHGPKGIGAIYIKKGLKVHPLLNGGGQEKNIRSGTENVPGIVGFGKATELKTNYEKVKELRDILTKGLLEIPDTKLNGTNRLPNNVNITFKFVEGEGILMHLNLRGICVSTGSACSSNKLEPSHVLMALGMKHEDAHGSIRFTLSKDNTKDEIEKTIKEVKEIVDNLRKISPLVK